MLFIYGKIQGFRIYNQAKESISKKQNDSLYNINTKNW